MKKAMTVNYGNKENTILFDYKMSNAFAKYIRHFFMDNYVKESYKTK